MPLNCWEDECGLYNGRRPCSVCGWYGGVRWRRRPWWVRLRRWLKRVPAGEKD